MTDTKQDDFAALEYLRPEIIDYLLSDCEQGRLISDKVLTGRWPGREGGTGGIAGIPIDRESFLAIAPFLQLDSSLVCLHANEGCLNIPSFGNYMGPLLVVFDPKQISADQVTDGLQLNKIMGLDAALLEFDATAN